MKHKLLRFSLLSMLVMLSGLWGSMAYADSEVHVTFSLGDLSGVEGTLPDAVAGQEGMVLQIPVNRTLYREGYTLVGWTISGSTEVYVPGQEVSITENTELIAAWHQNTLTPADVSGEAEATWYFGKSYGAPSVNSLQGGTTILVTQLPINKGEVSEKIDLKLTIDASKGKYHNADRGDQWAQMNDNTQLIFPSTKGADVELDTYGVPTGTTLNGVNMEPSGSSGSAYASGQVNSTAATSTVIVMGANYASMLRVIYNEVGDEPVVEPKNVTVHFLPSDDLVQGVAPADVVVQTGGQLTLPKNFTFYKEGYTLTGWTDPDYLIAGAPGETITIPEDFDAEALNLVSVFTENPVSLADRTEEVTVKWDFQRKNGAPSVQWQNQDGLVWVTQALVNGYTIDVALPFSTAPGKFNNTSWSDWCQLNNGTTFSVPSCKGATISIEAFNTLGTGDSPLTIDGQSDYTQGKTVSYTVQSGDNAVQLVIGNEGSYYRYIQSVLPVVESGTSYTDEDFLVEWKFDDNTTDETLRAYTATPIDAVSVASFNYTPEGATIGKASRSKDPDSGLTFVTFKGQDVQLHWFVKPTAGLTITPTQIRMYVQRFGTDKKDGVVVSAQKEGDDVPTVLGTYTARRANYDDEDEKNKWGSLPDNLVNEVVINLTADQQEALAGGDGFHLYATTGLGSNKDGGFYDIRIYGLVNGTIQNVNQYTLAVSATPEEGGSVSVYPVAEAYDEDTEVTLTATENFGYDFVAWKDANNEVVSYEAKYKHKMTADTQLFAEFQQVDTYAMNLTVEGANDYMVTVSPAPTMVNDVPMYEAGTTVVLTANQYPDLVIFNGWEDQSTTSEREITINENMDITAHYAQADIIAGWDFYKSGANGRLADYASEDNQTAALTLVNTATGNTGGWLDKSTEAGGYEGFKGAAVNWQQGVDNGDVGNWHWQTAVNASAFTNINVQFQMLYNFNAYQTYKVQYSADGEEWQSFGSITMTGPKQEATFNGTLPEEANNLEHLYIRMIADKENSQVDGAPSKNDGNSLAMFFITGEPQVIDDGMAPGLVTTVPEEGATGVSAAGKIVLTFDEKIKVSADEEPAVLMKGGEEVMELIPIVAGNTVSFGYKGLEYDTQYTFVLPANSVSDLTDNFLGEEVTVTFTTMERPTVDKQFYDEVVSNTEELVNALANAENRADKNTRYRIFIKDGEYTLPLKYTTMKSCNGFELPECITFINASNISFIGEHRDGVVITNDIPANETFQNEWGTVSKYEGIGNGDVFQIGYDVSGLYWQDLTVSTAIEDARGRDIAIQDKGTKNIYKNISLQGYQDTWTSGNDLGLYYFEDGVIRGCTDYMCGKGDIYFNRVELRQLPGGYAAVPSHPAKVGWVFKECTINAEGGTTDGNYTLGRPWGKGTPIALFIDTKMNVIPSPVGWSEMSGGWPARFAEYNSMTANGAKIDLSGRKKIFGEGHENNPELTLEEAVIASDMSNMYGEWEPLLATEQAPVPTDVKLNGTTLTWTGSEYALLYAVCKNGHVVGFTLDETYEVDDTEATWTVRAANEMGGLCEESEVAENVTDDEEEATEEKELATIDAGAGVYYATNYGDYAYRIDGNTTAYTATLNGGVMQLSEIVDNIIPEKSAVILRSSNNPIVITPLDEEAGKYTDALDKDFANNDLQGQKSPKTATEGKTLFALNVDGLAVGFYPTDGPIDAFTAFVELPNDQIPSIDWLPINPDETTAIFELGGTMSATPQFFRTFDEGVASTICLPYAYDPGESGTLYEFIGVSRDNFGEWTATMQESVEDAVANTPYLFMPAETKTHKYNGTFVPAETPSMPEVTSGDWTFKGTYSTSVWGDSWTQRTFYGFSADDHDDIAAGDFVRVGKNTICRALRGFLQYTGSDDTFRAPARNGKPDSLPEKIKVVLLDASGTPTAIGELNTETGDAGNWYDLNGRKLEKAPSQKGIYIKDGKKVVKK